MSASRNLAVETVPTADVVTPPAPPAFEEVYSEHFPFVWRTARRLGIDNAAIDDVCQEVFVVVHRRLPEFEGRSTLRTWLYGILSNTVRTHQRTRIRKRDNVRDADVDVDHISTAVANPQEQAGRVEAAAVAQQLIAQLDEEKRMVFVLTEIEEMSVKEVAETLGVNVNTTHARLRAARREFARLAACHRARDNRRLA